MEDMGVTSIRLPEALLRRLDEWRAGRLDDEGRQMTRSAAMRHLVMRALDREAGRRGQRERRDP
jgi:metal-responsive CopG/Arc/MetJ family transcriptional regulator